jgi:hypothetical protein
MLCSLAGIALTTMCHLRRRAAALQVLWSVDMARLKLLSLSAGEGYTAPMYATAALLVLDSAHHAVGRDVMHVQLGRHVVGRASTDGEAMAAGVAVLGWLVDANAFSVRPQSDWAQDLPVEAFAQDEIVVTAPSATDLYCIRLLRPQLEQWLVQRKVCCKVGARCLAT